MKYWLFSIVSLSVSCTDSSFLDTGDVLVVSFEPAFLFTDDRTEVLDCDGGAVANLAAWRGDGTSAGCVDVQLWLEGPTHATLSADAIELKDDGTNEVCLLPGTIAGSTTLHARSGPVERTAMLQIHGRHVPTGGSIAVVASPPSATTIVASSCGTASCSAVPRQATITLLASGTETIPVPDQAKVSLTTSLGWLSSMPCTIGAGSGILDVSLANGHGSAFACFDSTGGTAMLTARSGTVSQTTQLTVRTVLRALELTPNRTTAAVNDKATLTAFVSDCDMQPVANVSVTLQVTDGGFTLDMDSPLTVKSSADGIATFTGTVTDVPLTATAHVIGASQVSCAATIGAP